MSEAEVHRYTDGWMTYLRELAGHLVECHAALAGTLPVLEEDRLITEVLPEARSAATKVTSAVRDRIRDFPVRRSVREGGAWEALEARYLAAVAVIRGVESTIFVTGQRATTLATSMSQVSDTD